MSWECAECRRGEGQRTLIDAVCHHCGKLLCREDRSVIADTAFDPPGGEAVHCGAWGGGGERGKEEGLRCRE